MTDILSIYFETITIYNNLGISGKQTKRLPGT